MENARALWEKYKAGLCSEEERILLENWFHHLETNHQADFSEDDLIQLKDEMWGKIVKKAPDKKLVTFWLRAAAAASILIACSTAGYFVFHRQQQPTQQVVKNDIAPGRNQATLTLANGQKIVLTKGLEGKLAVQNSTIISAKQNAIIYDANKSENQFSYNTLTTARGEQLPCPLVLSDGTKVWLNTASSITFPTAFKGNARIVKITGEALFEVKHNARQPFKVQTVKQTIEDIGTIFDVNAYSDESATRTTLVEGRVKVNNLTLIPGQQTDGKNIKTVNTEIVTAWKNGNFHFEGDNIQSVMRQLSRWYNIDVIYQGPVTNEVFFADISRDRNISAALKILQNTKDVHFKIEGRRVIIIE
ncbi:FecR family protein [Mucilaginibacter sp. UR6-11]|uniref:FecR family protein n=1 Tax=Mucilaginibacter sp. UR6-11 TaxID=1435644 RepID=UPI001E61E710|nr:FecR family protein [Mucilaginibacter sp. UR6-11]MCC8424297.1 FecR family protein [Mucilaginibacter sp. UR6-11]